MEPIVEKTKRSRKSVRPEKITCVLEIPLNSENQLENKRLISETLIECNKRDRFVDEEALNNDLNRSTSTGPPFICIICTQWFLSKEKLFMHYISNHKKISCHMCLLVFDNNELCQKHENKSHYPLYCEICNEKFNKIEVLEKHYTLTHNTVSCRFCNLLIQPQSCYYTHIYRKHNVHDDYKTENLKMIDKWFDQSWNFRCRMCNKNRPKKDTYGHFRMHHKITAISFINVINTENAALELNGSKDQVIPMKKSILEVTIKSETSNCSVCEDSKIPLIFHQVYCMKKFACKYCFETFHDHYLLHYHKEISHKFFRCGLGCINVVSPNERELEIHYKKFHDVIACKFCDVCVADQQKYDMHLINEHSIKDIVVEEILDSDLFEEKMVNNEKTVICCLCEKNITDMMPFVEVVYAHYTEHHSMLLKTLVGYNQSNPFSSVPLETSKLKPKIAANSEEDVSSQEEVEDDKDIEIFEDVDPKDIECSIYDCSSDEEDSYDLTIKEEPFDDYDDDSTFNNDSNALFCELCYLKFSSKSELLEHMHVNHDFHAKLSALICNECLEKFTNESKLELHLINVHGKNLAKNERECKCPFCKIVSFKKHIRHHIQAEHSKELEGADVDDDVGYNCRHCEALFWKPVDRNEHEIEKHLTFHENSFFKCYVCYKVFSRKYCLKKHFDDTHKLEEKFDISKIAYKCLKCNVLLPRLQETREHFISQHPELVNYKCAFQGCDFKNVIKTAVETHIKDDHQKSTAKYVLFVPKSCEICGKYLSSQKSAKIHYRMKHTGERIGFGCRLCSERFDSVDKRKLHYAVAHTGIRAFICSVCGKGFNSKSGLYGHKQLHNNNSFECEYCHKIFVRKDTYNEHILIHSGPRHQCQYCSRSFTQRSNLIRHTRIHTGEKPYQCPMCPKKFSDKGACNSHIRVHTREEVCSCPFCGKTYSKKQKLKYHLKTHTGEEQLADKQNAGGKTLICSECNQGFSDERYLHRHIITTHVEVACNYKCQICGEKFITQNHLNSHMLTHSGVKHTKCLLCEAAYASEESIVEHLRDDHKISNAEMEKYFKQLSSDEVGKLLKKCLKKETNPVNIVFSDIKPINIPPTVKVAKIKKLKNKRQCTKHTNFEYDDDSDEIISENTFIATKSRQVKKPKRYIDETEVDFSRGKSETIVNANKFLQIEIKEEMLDDYDDSDSI